MNSLTDKPGFDGACGEPMRRMFYERVGQYFEDEGIVPRVEGTCTICGAFNPAGVADAMKKPVCRAQRSISQNRKRAKEGLDVAFGSVVDEKSVKNSLNGKGAITLITDETSFVACNVIPSKRLPNSMRAEPVIPGVQGRFIKEFVANPPKPPFLLVLWDRKASIPLVQTMSLSRLMVCGGDVPKMVDLREVQAAVALIERIGAKKFKAASWLRSILQTETRQDAIAKMNVELRGFVEDDGITREEFKRLPKPGGTVATMALQAMGEEEAAVPDAAEDDVEAA